MLRATLVASFLLALPAASALADDDFTVLMKRHSAPGESGELFVFVGEQLSYKSLDLSCDDCWVFDSWHTARYRVSEWIQGVPPGPELEFEVAEHAVNVPFGHSMHALMFVESHGDTAALVKYQQVPVYPTAEGSFASCGPIWGGPAEDDEPLEGPALRDIRFSPRLVVDDARRLSALGRAKAHDPRWHEIEGNEVLCTRGVPARELVRAIVREHDMLRAALPGLAGEQP